MGKNKRHQKSSSSGKGARPTGVSKPKPKSRSSKKTPTQPQHSSPTIPFQSVDKILLVGEGDLSFARSLVEHHGCRAVTATVLEGSEEELMEKYPIAEENIQAVRTGEGVIRFGVDVGKKGLGLGKKEKGERGEGWERVFFNFPHVGGKSKDVNRQVRYNQELLVSFFTHIRPLLSPLPGSSILVTLFEGEPYTLWNIRDLARHSTLEVKRSFRFQAKAYPGYRHARTLGVVKGKSGEIGAGWKGEERDARTYEFVRKGEGAGSGAGKGKVKGRYGEDDSSEESGHDTDGNELRHMGDGEDNSNMDESDETTDNNDDQEDGED